MTNFSNKFKNPYFWLIFSIFGTKFFFSKIRLSRTTPHGPLTPYLVSEKTNEPIPRKLPEGIIEGQKDGQTLIHRTLPITAEGSIKSFS